jgi:LmbE family N-acetylglucosaminyl deacetylase
MMKLDNLNAARNYDYIYLAPHPDDAALSCGGTIACHRLSGKRQLVVTLCSALPPSDESHWVQRLDEEKRALDILQVDNFHGGFLDAPFRHTAYKNDAGLFAAPVTDDPIPKAVNQLVITLAEQNKNAIVYAPLGVGKHVDHLIAYSAAKSCGRFKQVHYYEDFPYVADNPAALEARLKEIGTEMTSLVTDIREGFQTKIDAIGQYNSQILFLFKSHTVALETLIKQAQLVLPGGLGERKYINAHNTQNPYHMTPSG